MTLDSVEK